MKLPARVLSCLLICCFSTTLFAQSVIPLTKLQAQAKQQTSSKPWIKKYLIPSAVSVGVGGIGWLAIDNMRQRHQKRQLEKQIKELENGLQDYRYEVNTLRQQRASLVTQRDNALNLWEQAQKMLEMQQKKRPLIPHKTATKHSADSYKYLARTDLSKRLLFENSYQFSYLTDREIRSVLANLDNISQNVSSKETLMQLNALIQKAPTIGVKQIYIQAGRYVKMLAVVALFSALVAPAESQAAQNKIHRLEHNPALFLQADQAQLQAWEKDPKANALCRQIAQAIDQAAALPVSEAEAQDLTLQAAAQHMQLQAKNAAALTKTLAR